MPVSIKDIVWVAGILEGEGCFITVKYSPAIRLKMTDLDIITKVKAITKCKNPIGVREPPKVGHKTQYIIALYGSLAAQWMMTIYSLMGVRRKAKIREMLELWKIIKEDRKFQKGWGMERKLRDFNVSEEKIAEFMATLKNGTKEDVNDFAANKLLEFSTEKIEESN